MRYQEKTEIKFESIIAGFLIFVLTFIVGAGFIAWEAVIKAGNESNAVQIISSYRIKQNKYSSEHRGEFALTFAELDGFEELKGENFIKDGYVFTINVINSDGKKPAFYSVNADPQTRYVLFSTGDRHFYYDSTLGTIKSTEENR